MRCFECGRGQLKIEETAVSVPFRGESFEIRALANVCPKCGYKSIPPKHAESFGVALADAYRRRHGLLTSTELKEIRNGLALTQAEFAAYLCVGVASVKRWERGLVQDRAMDELIRLKTDPFMARTNYEQLSRQPAGRVPPAKIQYTAVLPACAVERLGSEWKSAGTEPAFPSPLSAGEPSANFAFSA